MKNVDSIPPQNHGLKLITISSLILSIKLIMLIFTEIIYTLRYNTTKNWDA